MLEMGILTRFSCMFQSLSARKTPVKSPKAKMRDVVIVTQSGVERQAGSWSLCSESGAFPPQET